MTADYPDPTGNEQDAPALANAFLERATATEYAPPVSGEFSD